MHIISLKTVGIKCKLKTKVVLKLIIKIIVGIGTYLYFCYWK